MRENQIARVATLVVFAALFLVTSNGQAQAPAGLAAVRVASGLSAPIFVTAPAGDYNRLFIVQLNGQIKILNLASGLVNSAPFVSIAVGAAGEQGLLGLAFDPEYATNGKFYVHYDADVGQGVTHVTQYQVSANPDLADTTPANIKTLFTVTQPQTNHNGGWIGFSPRANDDHNLYIALGDGGNADDADGGVGHHEPGGNAQWDQTLLGKMLRIHVDPATGTYSIPANNPFAGSSPPVMEEIWLLGLRNPFRDSFDRLTGRMFIGDVGQDTREEVDVQLPSNPGGGENYGWRDREGFIQNPTYATATPTPTPVPPRVDPIFDYPRTNSGAPSPISGRTVVGGYVYRGKQIPQLQGTYVFGDYLGPSDAPGGRIHTLNFDGTNSSNPQNITGQLFPTSVGNFSLSAPAGFGEDANGEIYICDINTGDVFRIVPTTPNVKIDNVSKNGNPFVLHGIGVPFTSVTVQSTGNLTQAFGSPVSVPVIGDGTFQFIDPNPSSPRFYRVVYP
jgi:glucose/arabinose dehydrogenase